MIFTEEQNLFLNSKSKAILVEALAGCSKTTLAIEKAKHITEGDNLYLAFNNSNIKHIEKQLPANWKCHTVHSHANSIINLNSMNLLIDRDKYSKVFSKTVHDSLIGSFRDSGKLSYNKVSSKLYGTALDSFNQSKTSVDTTKISFDDMLYITKNPLLNKPKYVKVIIDEFQDLNLLQLNYIFSIDTESIVFLGDRYQDIYGFMQSKKEEVAHIKEQCLKQFGEFNYFKVSTTFRFGKNICDYINDENLIPLDIQPIDNKKDKVIVKDLITPGYIKTLLLGNNKTACILFRFNKEIKDFKYSEPDLDKRIKLSTIHASKGLQYDIVHVPNYIFFRNAANNIESDDKFNEHMNLCYVALSRAKETLLLD